jgi:hypothetical protein
VGALREIHGENAFVPDLFFGQMIDHIFFLQQGVPCIFLVFDDGDHALAVPFAAAQGGYVHIF